MGGEVVVLVFLLLLLNFVFVVVVVVVVRLDVLIDGGVIGNGINVQRKFVHRKRFDDDGCLVHGMVEVVDDRRRRHGGVRNILYFPVLQDLAASSEAGRRGSIRRGAGLER